MESIFSFLHLIDKYGVDAVLIILSVLIIYRFIKAYILHHQERQEKIDKIYAAIVDPDDPDRVYRRKETHQILQALRDRLDQVEILLQTVSGHCFSDRCPFHDDISNLNQEILCRIKDFETHAIESRAETKRQIEVITEDVQETSLSLLDLAKTLILRDSGGRGSSGEGA